jgi:N-acetylmuramoyl-L-alanine amidase
MAFKIALTAGHYLDTPGKRCLKSLDPKETREWVLNDRIADKVEKLLAANYTGYQLIRTDDTTGKKDISLTARTNAANNFKADIYISIHHNAGVNGGKGGGIVAYTYTNVDQNTKDWQKALYNALIAETGLKGNRATPLAKANLAECRQTTMAAVLLELGFMDSKTDVPVILTEAFADQCARAIVKVIAERGKLTKKDKKTYIVQVGPFDALVRAEVCQKTLQKAGIASIIVEGVVK